ncbi:MAG: S8 family serine peptidase [Muribaculaceae bacterium]|nr:S8 family serine peptidase [Muribaculaceae bacterium]
MKRLIISISIALFTSVMMLAGIFPARTSIELAKQRATASKAMNSAQQEIILQAFITVDNIITLTRLNDMGAKVNSCFGNTATITIPLSMVGHIAQINGVKRIEMARHLTLCNDKARELSHFPSRTYGQGSNPHPINTGNGVVVGMIDVGIDFNHINFIDNDGNSRIVRVYMPCDSTGTAPVVNGMELPGSEYTTPEQIRMLTTDDPTMYHGTHTTGTAAGGYLANGYYGVATGAQIVACGMTESSLTDVNVANSIRYIFDYADKVGLPAVINMSIGSQEGAHDGTSTLCQLFNEVSGPGRICVVSAGNDGNMPMNIRKTLSENDSLATFLTNWYSREPMRGYSSMWSRSSQRHTVDIEIWDIKDKIMIHHLDIPTITELDSVYVVSSETDSIFAQYFTGEIYFVCTLEDNGLFHSLVETDYTTIDRSRYRIGLVNKAPAGETLIGWCGGQPVYSKSGVNGWTGGVVGSGCTVSDLATADSVISVGAYCSNNSFIMMDGSTKTIGDCNPYDIAFFSGYGPDVRNKQRPDLVAPGYMMASSASRYVEAFNNPANVVDQVTIDGTSYPYGLEGGTSMSAPVVSGAIALWLEIVPNLSPSNLREIMEATCYSDSYVENGPAKKWGYGKLDIEAGIEYLITKLDGDVDGDGYVSAADITCIYDILLGISNQHIQRADIDCDGTITAADVSVIYNKLLGL